MHLRQGFGINTKWRTWLEPFNPFDPRAAQLRDYLAVKVHLDGLVSKLVSMLLVKLLQFSPVDFL